MANILSWAGKKVKQAENVVNRVAPAAAHIAVSPFAPVTNAYTSGVNDARGLVGLATHNKVAANNAFRKANAARADTLDLARQFTTRPLTQVATSLTPHQVTTRPTNILSRALIGDKPVQNIQAGTATNYKQHHNIPLAIAYGAGQLAQDIPAVKGVKPVSKAISKELAPMARDIALNKPFRKVSDAELQAAQRVAQQRQGFGEAINNVKPADVQTYRRVQQKLGVDANNHDAVDRLIGARATYQTKLANMSTTANRLKPQMGLSMKDVSKEPTVPVSAAQSKPIPQLSEGVKTPKVTTKLVNGEALANGRTPVPKTQPTPQVVENSLTSKVGQQNVSPEAQSLVSGDHVVRNTQALNDRNQQLVDNMSAQDAIQQAHVRLAVKPGTISDEDVAFVTKAIEKAGAEGHVHDEAALHDALSEQLVANGQTTQAATLLYNLTPQGRYYKAIRDLQKALPRGQKISPELDAKLKDMTQQIKLATDETAKQRLTAQFQKLVADNIPKGKLQGALSVWKAGLLSGPLTQAGNFASNATFGALKKISDLPATLVDKGLSLGTGQRTKTLTGSGITSGTKQGVKSGIDTLKTGIDVRNITGNKYEVHGELNFKNPVIQSVFGKPSNLVFRGMSAADQPFYYAALKNNLADLAKADGINKGLRGRDLGKYMAETMNNPSKQMAETAKLAAQKAVLGQDSKIASSISKIAQDHPAIQAVVPFVKVPINYLSRTLDFSPAGLGKAGLKIYKDSKAGRPFDQRALSEAIGEGLTGTGIITVGAMLANNNLLSGQYPSNDQKEVQRWKAEGIQPNSVKLGNKWINLNYLGPIGLLLGAGKDYHTAASQGDNGAMQAIAGFGKSLAGQSFLTGFSGAANAINDPGRYGANFVHSQAASVIPAWLNAVGNATDSKQRQADSTVDSVKARIPAVRNKLPVKNDVYGNELKQRTNPLDITVDPLKPSNDLSKKNPVVAEVNRLHTVDPNNKDLQVTPTPVDKKTKVDGVQLNLNNKQAYTLRQQVGQSVQTAWDSAIKSDAYKTLDDTGKANMLNSVRQDATNLAEREFVTNNSLGTFTKEASTKVANLANDSPDFSSYATSADNKAKGITATPSDAYYKAPDAEYKALLTKAKTAHYNSPAAQVRAEDALAKAKVGSTFDKSIRDLYGLTSKQLYSYVSNNPDGNNIVKQVLAYGDALVQANQETKNKFRSKYGSVTLGNTASSSRKSGTSRIKKLKTPKALKTTGFKVKVAKAPSFKTKRAKIPKYVAKTPKVTKKAIA